MKLTNILSAALLGIGLLTSCGSDEAEIPEPGKCPIRLNLGVSSTRASHSGAQTITDLGMSYNKFVINEKLTVTDGKVSGYTPSMYWRSYTNQSDFIFYTPHTTEYFYDNERFTIGVEPVQTADSYKSDFLFQKITTSYNSLASSNFQINLSLQHKMTELTVNLFIGDDTPVTADMIKTVKVNNVHLNGDYYYNKNIINPIGKKGSVTPYLVTDGAEGAEFSYRCILVPQTVEGLGFEINVGGTNYKWVSPGNVTFNIGERTSIDLYISRDKIVAGNIGTTPWQEENVNDQWQTN